MATYTPTSDSTQVNISNTQTDNMPDADKIKTINDFLEWCKQNLPEGNTLSYDNIITIKFNTNEPETSYTGNDKVWLKVLAQALNKCGLDIECPSEPTSYNLEVSRAVMEYQEKYLPKKRSSGILDNGTLCSILRTAKNNCPDNIEEETVESSHATTDMDPNYSAHYTPFFDKQNSKQFRQNKKNIKIVFGNSGITKELHDVIMRSVGVEVDTSGNPISETYEFIARDVTETDEETDVNKYTTKNDFAPSDIQYKFNFK